MKGNPAGMLLFIYLVCLTHGVVVILAIRNCVIQFIHFDKEADRCAQIGNGRDEFLLEKWLRASNGKLYIR